MGLENKKAVFGSPSCVNESLVEYIGGPEEALERAIQVEKEAKSGAFDNPDCALIYSRKLEEAAYRLDAKQIGRVFEVPESLDLGWGAYTVLCETFDGQVLSETVIVEEEETPDPFASVVENAIVALGNIHTIVSPEGHVVKKGDDGQWVCSHAGTQYVLAYDEIAYSSYLSRE